MSTVLIVPDKQASKTEKIPENKLLGAIFTGIGDRVVKPTAEKIIVTATNYLMVTPAELGELRDYTVGRNYREISNAVLENPLFLECVDLVAGRGDEREVFLRALAIGVDKANNKAFKNDQEHMIKLSLRSLMTIKAAKAVGKYVHSNMEPHDVETIESYFDIVPDAVDFDLEKKKLADTFEKDVMWRITPLVVTPAIPATADAPVTEATVVYTAGFSESTVSLKRHSCGEPPATKVAKRAREEEEKEERIEESEKISRLFKSVIDVPGARYFTFNGSYEMSKLMVVEDADGTQSIMIPFAK